MNEAFTEFPASPVREVRRQSDRSEQTHAKEGFIDNDYMRQAVITVPRYWCVSAIQMQETYMEALHTVDGS